MRLIYNFSIWFYGFAVAFAATFDKKAKLWISGRRNWEEKLREKIKPGEQRIWFHCASLGEFEQGRMMIEKIRKQYPESKIFISFFSPSGYENKKNYPVADYMFYLPLDTPSNARKIAAIIQPKLAVFIKYELWVNIILQLAEAKIPTILVSAKMLPGSAFFRSYFKSLYKAVFKSYSYIFTQDEETAELIRKFSGQQNIFVAGDTRFDQVISIAENFEEVPGIKKFLGNNKCIVAGSIWPNDEKLIRRTFSQLKGNPMRWIIAPHEINHKEIYALCEEKKEIMVPYSLIETKQQPWHRMLWIDNIGMLSKLYHYAEFAYIGGGFDNGIHNILEAAVYGCPVIFGPNYKKFPEAVELVENGGAIVVDRETDLGQIFRQFIEEPAQLEKIKEQNRKWVRSKSGASERVLERLREVNLLDKI